MKLLEYQSGRLRKRAKHAEIYSFILFKRNITKQNRNISNQILFEVEEEKDRERQPDTHREKERARKSLSYERKLFSSQKGASSRFQDFFTFSIADNKLFCYCLDEFFLL